MAAVNLAKFDDSTHISTASAAELAATLTPAGTVTLGINTTIGGKLKLEGATSGDCTIQVPSAAGTATNFTLPNSNGTNHNVLLTDGTGAASWGAPNFGALDVTCGNVTASGSVNVGNSVTATLSVTGNALQATGGQVIAGQNSTATGDVQLQGVTSGAVDIKCADAAGTWTMTLPTSAGSNHNVLSTDGTGVASWTDGSNIAALNASNLSSGTIPTARFPAGTVLQTQMFTLVASANVHTSSSTPQATGLTVNITPQRSNSVIKIEFCTGLQIPAAVASPMLIGFYRDSTLLGTGIYVASNGNQIIFAMQSQFKFDAPGDTSVHTYSIKFSSPDNTTDVIFLTWAQACDHACIMVTEIAQ